MFTDFWAGYVSGAAGIIIGNPLDIIKVHLQVSPGITPFFPRQHLNSRKSFVVGTTAPLIGYGGLNALLFVTYHQTAAFLSPHPPDTPVSLGTTFVAGAVGGLASWLLSVPTELIKCRAQVASSHIVAPSFWAICKSIIRTQGIRGLYLGGGITACRDSIGYGFYFSTYELASRQFLPSPLLEESTDPRRPLATTCVLLSGGLAGVVSWASIFPLDTIKTRLQTQVLPDKLVGKLTPATITRRLRAVDIARSAYRNEGPSIFFRGLSVCCVRAFLVNAVQWTVYEWAERILTSANQN